MTDKQKRAHRLFFIDMYITLSIFTVIFLTAFIAGWLLNGWNNFILVIPAAYLLYISLWFRYISLLVKSCFDIKNNLIEKSIITVSSAKIDNKLVLVSRSGVIGREKFIVMDTSNKQYRITYCQDKIKSGLSITDLLPPNKRFEIVYLKESKIIVEISPIFDSEVHKNYKKNYLNSLTMFFGNAVRT